MNEDALEKWIKDLIAQDKLHTFYISSIWKSTKREVLKEQNHECQRCKLIKKIYTKATTVHHKKYVRKYPRLALTKSNLEAICEQCHYDEHHRGPKKGFINEEKW